MDFLNFSCSYKFLYCFRFLWVLETFFHRVLIFCNWTPEMQTFKSLLFCWRKKLCTATSDKELQTRWKMFDVIRHSHVDWATVYVNIPVQLLHYPTGSCVYTITYKKKRMSRRKPKYFTNVFLLWKQWKWLHKHRSVNDMSSCHFVFLGKQKKHIYLNKLLVYLNKILNPWL